MLDPQQGTGAQTKDWRKNPNCVFWAPVKTTHLAVFSENLPLFTAILVLTTRPKQWVLSFHCGLKYPPFSYKTSIDNSACALPGSKKVPFHSMFLWSSIGTKLASKCPPLSMHVLQGKTNKLMCIRNLAWNAKILLIMIILTTWNNFKTTTTLHTQNGDY